MKKIVVPALLIFVLLLSACSPVYRLNIVNLTSEPLKITYVIKEGRTFYIPETSTSGSFAYEKMDSTAFKTNADKRERTLEIGPNVTVTLESGGMGGNADELDLDISSITLNGSKGEKVYSGEKFFLEFKTETLGHFSIEYK